MIKLYRECKITEFTNIIVLVVLLLTFNNTFSLAQSILTDIPDSLIDNSHMVIVDEQFDFTIVNKEKTIEKVSKNYIVLKDSKFIPKFLKINYSKFVKISKAQVKIYDQNDNLIKKYSRSDFEEYLMVNGSVAGDGGIKFVMIPEISTPYRVVFTYKKISKNSLFYPEWKPIKEEHQSVLSASLKVNDNLKKNLRFKLFGISNPKEESSKKAKIYTWKIENRKAIQFEPFNDKFEDYFPKVLLSPKKFEVDGFEGNMSSWKSFGQWINRLNRGRDNLSKLDKKEIKDLVNEDDSKLEKVKKIYKYLQDNTRYASIQLGIGGWQPYESGYTHEKKYGDCKALTFYTQSMLNAIDITSYYTLVRAGEKFHEVPIDFPNAKFNHAFLMIPMDSDTVWLECTSQTVPFGYLGYFTDDRNVLVVKKDGGHLIRSKSYNSAHNINSVRVDIKMEVSGSAFINLKDEMIGIAIQRNDYYNIINVGIEAQKKWFYDNLDLGNFEISKFKVNPVRDSIIPVGSFEVMLKMSDFGIVSGKNIIVKPFIFNKLPFKKLVAKQRNHSLYIRRSFILEDSIKIEIPDGYKLNSNIEPIEINSDFGKYMFSIEKFENFIVFNRKVEIYKGAYAKSEYIDFKTFINTILEKENQRFVFEK